MDERHELNGWSDPGSARHAWTRAQSRIELLGIVTLFYGLATVAEFFVSGQLSRMLEERRVQKMIDSFSEHHIICGFGRVGRR
jgi:hypothetical protein